MNRARNQTATRGRRASTTAASTGPPKRAPSRTALPPIALGTQPDAAVDGEQVAEQDPAQLALLARRGRG